MKEAGTTKLDEDCLSEEQQKLVRTIHELASDLREFTELSQQTLSELRKSVADLISIQIKTQSN